MEAAMTDANLASKIEESQKLTIQSEPRKDPEVHANVFTISWLARAGTTVPPWWSTARDIRLREFWKTDDYLSGALYNMTSKMSAIPLRIVARNESVRADVEEAAAYTDLVNLIPGFGKGWVSTYETFVEELMTQDNGSFQEVIGPGPKDGPILGRAISVSNLDSSRCQRTGNAKYPVIYTDTDGKRYKLHFGRVIFMAQMASPIAEMIGVGFCGISRCINVAQSLLDILIYKQEKLGSRPHRALLITQGGLDPDDLHSAFALAEEAMDTQGLSRYAKSVALGSSALPEGDVKKVDLAELPDGFDERTAIELGMATIALAFGMDARELFPAITAGATRADALLQHLKQRGKGPGQILNATESQYNFKFLPQHLKVKFDFQDDAQDRQSAEIRLVRANRRVQDVAVQVADQRTLREIMVSDGDIDQHQFESLELEDGRLPDGTPSIALFFSKSREYSQYLDLGTQIENPLNVNQNNADYILDAIADKRAMVLDTLINSNSQNKKTIARQAESALNQLELMYLNTPDPEAYMYEENADGEETTNGEPGKSNGRPKTTSERKRISSRGTKPGSTYIDPRLRRVSETNPTSADQSLGETFESM